MPFKASRESASPPEGCGFDLALMTVTSPLSPPRLTSRGPWPGTRPEHRVPVGTSVSKSGGMN